MTVNISPAPNFFLPHSHFSKHSFFGKTLFIKWLSCEIALVVSNSVQPHRRKPTRLPHHWDFPGKNTGVGCHFLLQCMKVKSESAVAQSCLTLSDPMDCSLPGSSIHGVFQARVLEWGAIAFSKRWSHEYLIIYWMMNLRENCQGKKTSRIWVSAIRKTEFHLSRWRRKGNGENSKFGCIIKS